MFLGNDDLFEGDIKLPRKEKEAFLRNRREVEWIKLWDTKDIPFYINHDMSKYLQLDKNKAAT